MAFFNINVFGEWARFGIFPGEMTVPVLLLFLSSMWFAYRKHLLGTDEDVVGWFIVLFFSGWAISFMLQFGGCILVSVPW